MHARSALGARSQESPPRGASYVQSVVSGVIRATSQRVRRRSISSAARRNDCGPCRQARAARAARAARGPLARAVSNGQTRAGISTTGPASGSRGLRRGEEPRGEPEGQLGRPLCPGDNCPDAPLPSFSARWKALPGAPRADPGPAAAATTTDTSGPGPAARAIGLYGGRGTRPNGTWRPGEIQPHVGEGQGLLHRRAHRRQS